jgi:hypothetical protein
VFRPFKLLAYFITSRLKLIAKFESSSRINNYCLSSLSIRIDRIDVISIVILMGLRMAPGGWGGGQSQGIWVGQGISARKLEICKVWASTALQHAAKQGLYVIRHRIVLRGFIHSDQLGR